MSWVQLSKGIELKNPGPWFDGMRFATLAEAETNPVYDLSHIFLVEELGVFCYYVMVEDVLTVKPLVDLGANLSTATINNGTLTLTLVGGQTLAVDLGISNIDNTADVDKPCSTAQDAAYKENIAILSTAGVILQEGYQYMIPSTCELDVDADLPTTQVGRSFAVTNKSTLTQTIGGFSLIAGTAASFVYYNGDYIEYSNNIE